MLKTNETNLLRKVVVITGASSGMGKAIALASAKRGAQVVLLARRTDLLADVAEECAALSHQRACAYHLDVSDPQAIDGVVAKIESEVGSVDVLVNAAGFGLFENVLDMPMATVESMFRVNVLGLMYLTRAFAKSMVLAHNGHIVNIASMSGKMATPKSAIYSATKFAVIGYSNGLRLELKPFNVRVTTVNPGPVDTEFFKHNSENESYLSRVGWLVLDPDQLARRVVNAMFKPVREINAPWFMEAGAQMYQLFPRIGDMLAGGMFNQK